MLFTKFMRPIRLIFLLGLISIVLHTVVQYALARAASFEFLQDSRHWFIISTMLIFLVGCYFILRRRNGSVRPPFIQSWLIMFFVQVFTIVFLSVINLPSAFQSSSSGILSDPAAIAMQFDPADFILKTLIFAVILPFIILTPLFLLDRRAKY